MSDGFSWYMKFLFRAKRRINAFLDSNLVGTAFEHAVGWACTAVFLSLFIAPSWRLAIGSLGLWFFAEYNWKNAHQWARLRSDKTR